MVYTFVESDHVITLAKVIVTAIIVLFARACNPNQHKIIKRSHN